MLKLCLGSLGVWTPPYFSISSKTSEVMWDHLKKVYNQSDAARMFHLEFQVGELSQGNMSIQEFYSNFENLWAECTDIVYANVPPEGLIVVHKVHEISKRGQFLMKLKGEFEAIRSNLMTRDPVPLLDICVGELLRKKNGSLHWLSWSRKLKILLQYQFIRCSREV
ncbi:uncharacterized protein LOC142550257 [Primulina tabacum]|uniref:uncharacterized protein LOC142550257 n=1 Tax=Primulina tabacum TaxID=48773 RepID=UPI003F59274B